jgi:hypothetical protein
VGVQPGTVARGAVGVQRDALSRADLRRGVHRVSWRWAGATAGRRGRSARRRRRGAGWWCSSRCLGVEVCRDGRLSRLRTGRARRLRPQRCRSASASSPPKGSSPTPSPARIVVCVGMAVSAVTGARHRSGRDTRRRRREPWCMWAWPSPRLRVCAAVGVDASGVAGAGRGVDGHRRLRGQGCAPPLGSMQAE